MHITQKKKNLPFENLGQEGLGKQVAEEQVQQAISPKISTQFLLFMKNNFLPFEKFEWEAEQEVKPD